MLAVPCLQETRRSDTLFELFRGKLERNGVLAGLGLNLLALFLGQNDTDRLLFVLGHVVSRELRWSTSFAGINRRYVFPGLQFRESAPEQYALRALRS